VSVDRSTSNRQGILEYGVYVPRHRLDRAAIGDLLGTRSSRGTRSVAGYDEDSTSMGVEAARVVLASPGAASPELLVFATTSPAYADKTNASAIHAALSLDASVCAFDAAGAVRSAVGALRTAFRSSDTTLLVAADIRSGRPGSPDESAGGDAAAAMLIGVGPEVIAEFVGSASTSIEVLERWRLPGERASNVWEERFGEQAYVPAAESAVTDLLKQADVTLEDIDHVVVVGTHARAVARVRKALGQEAAPLEGVIGNPGAAALLFAVAERVDHAEPGELVLAVSIGDGADALLLRTTTQLAERRPKRPVAALLADGAPIPYATFLTWRGELEREGPRRPDPASPAAPPTGRNTGWKYGFHGSRCTSCGTRHLPPQRVCLECDATDQMVSEPLADLTGTIATFTVDRLAYSLHPPVVAAVVDLDGGGRFQCELTDVDPDAVGVGDRVTFTFRRLSTGSNGVHNYFWKARPVTGSVEGSD
jgi:3-hydroxy-3-methylglutaryl CoA synthase/uncharacterized OB-fold protein